MSEIALSREQLLGVEWHGAGPLAGSDFRAVYRRRLRDRIMGRPGEVLVFKPVIKSLRDLVVFTSGKANYYISKVLNQFWNATAFSFPATLYFGLWTATLTAASTGSTAGEIAAGTFTWYARVGVTANTTNFPLSSGASNIQNATAITWAANNAGGATSAVTYIGVLDAATAGNLLYFGSITSATINTGDTAQINVNGLTASES